MPDNLNENTNIPVPTNYIGPEKVFGTSIIPNETDDDLLPIVSPINDYESFVPQGHKKDDSKPTFNDIPESLKTAIKSFIITCAIRIARGKKQNIIQCLYTFPAFKHGRIILRNW